LTGDRNRTLGVNDRSGNNRMNDRGGCGGDERSRRRSLVGGRGGDDLMDNGWVGELTGNSKNGGSVGGRNSARLIQSRSITRWVGSRSADLLVDDRSGGRLIRTRRDGRAGSNDRIGDSVRHTSNKSNTGRSALGI